ncbi:MAG: anti-CBASS protein Acb1 family protein [Blastomonas sp.]
MGIILNLADRLSNALTGTGTRRDARTANAYVGVPMNQAQIAAAYSGSPLMRKIVQIPAMDMVREWREWKLDAKQLSVVEAEEKRLALRQKVRQVEVLRGMGGGAFILGLPGNPSEPAPASIGRGQLAYVNIVSRWHLSFSAYQDDARLPGYGEPAMWTMSGLSGNQTIHPSRVIPFRADTTAALAMISYTGHDAFWGESTVQQVLDAVMDSDSARASFAALMHKARTLRIGIPRLMELASTQTGTDSLNARMAILATAESLHNAFIYDAGDGEKGGEKIDDSSYSFAGAKDILNSYAEFVAAVSDIPSTRLLGRSPEGMQSSGQSQQTDWNKKIKAMQELDLSPCLERLDRYLLQSAIGSVPAGQWYEWAPLDMPDQKADSERVKLEAETIQLIQNTGTIPERAMAQAVQSWAINEGMWPELENALTPLSDDERYGLAASEFDNEESEVIEVSAGGGEPRTIPARRAANDAAPRPLYVHRKLLNSADVIAWAKSQGIATTINGSDMHVTIAFSRQAIDWLKVEANDWNEEKDGSLIIGPGGPRLVERLGKDGEAVVLLFGSSRLAWRHEQIRNAGASWDWPEFQPHVTISYDAPEIDVDAIEPYRGELRFGPEIFEPLDDDWKAKVKES